MRGALHARSSRHSATGRSWTVLTAQRVRAAQRSRSRPQVRCQAVRFPAALPMLPFTTKEVLPPGSCKVLRLYDSSSYMLLLEELLSSPHQMLVHTAVEPTTGANRTIGSNCESNGSPLPRGLSGLPADRGGGGMAGDPAGRLGAYEAGAFVFCLSTIIKVIDVKQTDRGVLLRVQSEGRVAVKSLAQTRPYFRAVVVPLTDSVDLDRLQASMWRDTCGAVERLRALMRDVQNLASKFKSPETANLQRAMYWVDNPHPLVFSSSSMLLNSRTAELPYGLSSSSASSTSTSTALPSSPLASYDDFQPSKILAKHIQPDINPAYTDSESISSGSDSESDAQYAAAAAAGAEPTSSSSATAGTTSSSALPKGLPGAAAGSAGGSGGGSLAAAAILGAGGLNGGVIRSRPSLLDLERACRLSLAAIQILPRATEEEKAAMLRHQAAAMETQDVLERLDLALQVMGEARALLSAKCALMALSTAA